MMGVDPLHRIVAPRLWAGFLCMPLLAAIFNVVAIYGGSVVAVGWLGSDPGGFWSGMQDTVELWEDVGKGMVKSLVFALVVTWIAVWQGYDTEPTAEGIGLATTRTVETLRDAVFNYPTLAEGYKVAALDALNPPD